MDRLLNELQQFSESTSTVANSLFSSMCSFLTPDQLFTLISFFLNENNYINADLENVTFELLSGTKRNCESR